SYSHPPYLRSFLHDALPILVEGDRAGSERFFHRLLDLGEATGLDQFGDVPGIEQDLHCGQALVRSAGADEALRNDALESGGQVGGRKSTRLNSSHVKRSYSV